MGQIDQPTNPADRTLTLSQVLGHLDDACDRVGLDEDRRKMMKQLFIFGEAVGSAPEYTPLPDVSTMRLALETVQTWFNAGNLRTPALDAELMMQMNQAGYPLGGGIR